MLTVGLTGDVGAGKSTLLRVWRGLGANVVSADDVAKEQWQRPEVIEVAVARWGAGILKADGAPDYRRIAEAAFANEEEQAFTNALVHPGTRAEITRRVRALRGWIVVEIPLLYESGVHPWIDGVVYAAAPLGLRAVRNRSRGWDEEEVMRRERFLLPTSEKQSLADVVLVNDGDLPVWESLAGEWGARLMAMSTACELSTCCGSLEEAERIAEALLERRLVACVNIDRVTSHYRWQNEMCRDEEWRIACKTVESALRAAKACIRQMHSYDLPAIVATEIAHADFQTLLWVVENCQSGKI